MIVHRRNKQEDRPSSKVQMNSASRGDSCQQGSDAQGSRQTASEQRFAIGKWKLIFLFVFFSDGVLSQQKPPKAHLKSFIYCTIGTPKGEVNQCWGAVTGSSLLRCHFPGCGSTIR